MSSPMSGPDTIDQVLVYCQRHHIATTDKGQVQVGRFLFDVSHHSTGNSIDGYILDGEDSYHFLNCTWWFLSCYTFNESKWERGAWDHELEKAFGGLRELMVQRMDTLALEEKDGQASRQREADDRKEKFEMLFQ